MDITVFNGLGILMFVFSALATVVVEYGVFLPEIRAYTFFSGAAARNIFMMIFFIAVMQSIFLLVCNTFRGLVVRVKGVDTVLLQLLPAFCFFLLLLYVMILLVYGSPLLMGVDRFYFWKSIAPSWFRYVHSLMPQLAFIISFAYCLGNVTRTVAVLWGVIAVLSVIAGGEKFSGLFLMLVFAALPIFALRAKASGNSVKILFGFSVFIILMMGVVSLSYIGIYGDAFYDRIVVRLSLQGQMLWALDQHASLSALSYDVVLRSLFGLGGTVNDSGMPYLMYLVAPTELVDSYLAGGATFTAPFPANIQLFFGYYFAPLVVAVIACVVGFLSGLMILAIKSRSIVFSVLLIKFYWFFYIAVAMGEIRAVFDWKYGIYVLLVLGMMFVSAGRNSFSRNM
jgi:hypothetical protein